MKKSTWISGVSVLAAVAAIGLAPLARSEAAVDGVVHEAVRIPMDGGWVADGELTYPRGAQRRLPTVVLLHGSGSNDMNQTIPGGRGSTFLPVTQVANRAGFAVLRFNKRGVLGIGPQLSDDPALLYPAKPYEQVVRDAAAAVRFAGKQDRVDPARVFLLGHSEGTVVASNLAARPQAYGIAKPAGLVEMGVVGRGTRDIMYYQAVGSTLGRLHEQFDFDGDGRLTAAEATSGLIGQQAKVAEQLRAVLLDGDRINGRTDRDGDGALTIDTEVRPLVEAAIGFANYPHLTDAPRGLDTYLEDIARFPAPVQDLPRFSGPVLLLNGQTDIQTVVRGAIAADAALAAAGNRDHRLITYPGMSHFMNITTKYDAVEASPDDAVLHDIGAWLAEHR